MEIPGQEREAGVEIGDLGRRGARAQRRGFPRSGPQMRGPDGGRPSRDPGRTSNRPRLGRGTPDGAKKRLRRRCSRHAVLIWFFRKRALTAARALGSRQAGQSNLPRCGCRTTHWLRSMRSALATQGRGGASDANS